LTRSLNIEEGNLDNILAIGSERQKQAYVTTMEAQPLLQFLCISKTLQITPKPHGLHLRLYSNAKDAFSMPLVIANACCDKTLHQKIKPYLMN
jgi:hypothetical protein